jgi:uncharacterized delta-60 repeat protein
MGCGCGGGDGSGGSSGTEGSVEQALQVVTDSGWGNDIGMDLVVDSQGRILITGDIQNASGNHDMAIWRFQSDGTLDATFGTGGLVTYNGSANQDDYGHGIALDSDGKILVAGETKGSTYINAAVWRYNDDGTLDTSFDDDGMSNPNGLNDDVAFDLALDENGKILVVGYGRVSTHDMLIWRVKTDGDLDSTFGSGGIRFYTSGYGNDFALAVAIDSNGRILVAGDVATSTGDYDLALVCLDSNGDRDTTFGTDGVVTHNSAATGNGYDFGVDLVIDESDRMVMAGSSSNGSNFDMALWRFTASGALDLTFGSGYGFATINNVAGGNGDDMGEGVALDSEGRIYVTGTSSNGSNTDMVIARYTADGSLDTAFGTSGLKLFSNVAGGSGADEGFSIRVSSSGMALVVGSSLNSNGDRDMVLWRQ